MIRITIDASEFSRRFGALSTRLQPFVKDTFERAVKDAFGEVQKLTGKTATGRTDVQKLWRMKKKTSGTKTTYTIHNIYANWKVLWYREVGTPRHEISGKPLLHFYYEKEARWVKRFRVTHPGQEPRLMTHLTATHFKDNMNKYMKEIADEIDRLGKTTRIR